MLSLIKFVACPCRYADSQEEKARKLAKKAVVPPAKYSPFDILLNIAPGQYPLMDQVHAGLPAGFTGFNASGIPDANGMLRNQPMPLFVDLDTLATAWT